MNSVLSQLREAGYDIGLQGEEIVLEYVGEGHPDAALNGLYTHDSTHEGWPVLRNARGKIYCYRYRPYNQWYLSDTLTPDEDGATAILDRRGHARAVFRRVVHDGVGGRRHGGSDAHAQQRQHRQHRQPREARRVDG